MRLASFSQSPRGDACILNESIVVIVIVGVRANMFELSGSFDQTSSIAGISDNKTDRKGSFLIPLSILVIFVLVATNNLEESLENAEDSNDLLGTPAPADIALDVCIDLVELRGESLKISDFNKAYVVIKCDKELVRSVTSSTSHYNSSNRLLDIKGSNILKISAKKDSNPILSVELRIENNDSHSILVSVCDQLSLRSILKKHFKRDSSPKKQELKTSFNIENQEPINCSLSIHLIEAKSSVTQRIRKMSSQDLAEHRFLPLNNNEDDDEDDDFGVALPMALSFGI
jgi:hypothetical protein